jgi:hypothetical protein
MWRAVGGGCSRRFHVGVTAPAGGGRPALGAGEGVGQRARRAGGTHQQGASRRHNLMSRVGLEGSATQWGVVWM